MKVATVIVGYKRTFNLGDYNSIKIEVALEADLEEGDESQNVIANLQEQARMAVKAEWDRLPKKNGKS